MANKPAINMQVSMSTPLYNSNLSIYSELHFGFIVEM